MKKNELFISVVIVTKNDAKIIGDKLYQLQVYLTNHFVDYEIIIIDQSSSDGNQKAVEMLLNTLPGIRFIELAYPVNHEVAMAAGIENSIGDFVVLFSLHNDPIECILDIVKKCKAGSDIVVGVAPQRLSLAYRVVRPLIQHFLRDIGYNLPRNATSLRCLSRRAVNAVTRAGRFHHQFSVRIQKTGYSWSMYEYELLSSSDYKTFFGGAVEGLRLLVFNSTRPLRWMNGIGIGGSLLALTGAVGACFWSLFNIGSVSNTTYALIFISLMFMMLFTILAFLGEYIGRLLDDQGEQYLYSVIYEKNSSVMLDETRVNVFNDALSSDISMVQTGRNK